MCFLLVCISFPCLAVKYGFRQHVKLSSGTDLLTVLTDATRWWGLLTKFYVSPAHNMAVLTYSFECMLARVWQKSQKNVSFYAI